MDELRIRRRGDFVGFDDGRVIEWRHVPALLAAPPRPVAVLEDLEPPRPVYCRCVLAPLKGE